MSLRAVSTVSTVSIVLLASSIVAGCGGGGGGGGGVSSGSGAPGGGTSPAPSAAPTPAPQTPPATTTAPVTTRQVNDATLRGFLAQRGIGPAPAPAQGSPELVALGRALFFDKLLSLGQRDVSCATCHHHTEATSDALPLSIGVGGTGAGAARRRSASGQLAARHSLSVFQAAAQDFDVAFWDGRVSRDPGTGALTTPEPALNGPNPPRPDLAGPLTTALAAQAMFPVTSVVEMRGTDADPTNELAGPLDDQTIWARLMARLVGTNEGLTGGIEEYRQLFRAAFPSVLRLDDLTFGHAAQAIAAFERTLAFNDRAPIDDYVRGNNGAIPEPAKRGAIIFTGKALCVSCHKGPLLADQSFHDIATPQVGPGVSEPNDDRGRGLITGGHRQDYLFRTPSLRNVTLTAPYTHSGAYPTLEAVLDHYRDPSTSLLSYDPAVMLPPEFQGDYVRDVSKDQARLANLSEVVPRIQLTQAEAADVIAFLRTLTDPRAGQLTAPSSVPSGLPVD